MEKTECFVTPAQKNSDAGEPPKRRNTTLTTRRKFEIKNYNDVWAWMSGVAGVCNRMNNGIIKVGLLHEDRGCKECGRE